ESKAMYAITGSTGQVGSPLAEKLLVAQQHVCAVVRDANKGKAWKDRGCELAHATIEDTASLTAAFQGMEGVFVLVPPNFDPQPGFPEAQATGAALRSALETARPQRVVYLSTIGAQASQPNLLTQHTIIEKALGELPISITLLRRSVRMQVAPRDSWEKLFKSQGMKNPLPRIQMLDGFNEGWIEFERGEAGSRKGSVTLESVLKGLIVTT